MQDQFGRHITYLRLSVTDRCDLRCQYCMSENMTFLPKKDVLSFEELHRLCQVFISLGIQKIRITGGEPLVRKDILSLFSHLAPALANQQLQELTLTTNGTQLQKHAKSLADSGVKRINVSLDTLDPDQFRILTRTGDITQVFDGLAAAKQAGLQVKINTVAMKGLNQDQWVEMVKWAHGNGFDISFIEIMPMGDMGDRALRANQFVPLTEVKDQLSQIFTLVPSTYRSGGPARYLQSQETGRKIGLISPLTQNFCAGCNRIRLTCTGQLFFCLGQENAIDLRQILRQTDDNKILQDTIIKAMALKPEAHSFGLEDQNMTGQVSRHMSLTGG